MIATIEKGISNDLCNLGNGVNLLDAMSMLMGVESPERSKRFGQQIHKTVESLDDLAAFVAELRTLDSVGLKFRQCRMTATIAQDEPAVV